MDRLSGKPNLTKTQIQERVRRKKERIKMCGMPNPKGTPNQPQRIKVVAKPVSVEPKRSLVSRIFWSIMHRLFGEKW